MGAARNLATASIADAELVCRAREGGGWAFDALYRRHAPRIGGLAARLLGARQDVDDVVHDAFVVAFEKLGVLRDPSVFGAWLNQIAIMRVRQLLRRRRLRSFVGLSHPTADATLHALASREATPEQRAELGLLDAVLAELPTDERLAWMLRHVEGHSVEEISDELKCSLSTAKRRLDAASRRIERARLSHGWAR